MPGHLKRKRPGGGPEPSTATKTTIATTPKLAAPRRATRQSSIPPLPVPEDPEPRRRRRRRQQRADDDANDALTEILPPSLSPRGKENMLVDMHSGQAVRAQQVSKPSTRMTRYSAGQEASTTTRPSRSNIHLAKPSTISSPIRTITITPSDTQQPMTPPRFATSAGRGRNPTKLTPINPQSVSLGRNRPVIMATSVAQPSQNPASNSSRTPNSAARGTDSAARPDRNIDKIVLGDICFPAWYPSYYGKELLGGVPGNSTKSGKGTKSNGNLATSLPYQESKDDANGTTAHGRRDRDHPPMLNRLYVCPRCFKYSKELVTWWEHVRWCEQQGYLPGNKIYTHPKGKRTVLVPSVSAPKQGRGKRGSVGQRMVQEVVQDEGEWSIREVDGEDDVLFCQNLSLFGKLFLDNKSVFFDVTGFKYFLLVHTPPPPPAPTAVDLTETPAPPSNNNNNNRSQIVGFFSKEKMSWDNNNLACILVFPPWQRKGLGSLLMGISYEISRREGVLGGPEKPISDLGKRGYKHFWAGEICRWLLSLTPPTATTPSGEGESNEAVAVAVPSGGEAELVVDVEACSQATWIAPEDCLGVLREMGLAEEAGTGPPPVSRVARGGAAAAATAPTTAPIKEDQVAATAAAPGANTGTGAGGAMAEASLPAADTAPAAAVTDKVVRRVRISQAAVRAWVAANRISLERACDPDGFVEGYALKRKATAAEEEAV